jgi:hypothetical protein
MQHEMSLQRRSIGVSGTTEESAQISISHGENGCKNNIRLEKDHFILLESGSISPFGQVYYKKGDYVEKLAV